MVDLLVELLPEDLPDDEGELFAWAVSVGLAVLDVEVDGRLREAHGVLLVVLDRAHTERFGIAPHRCLLLARDEGDEAAMAALRTNPLVHGREAGLLPSVQLRAGLGLAVRPVQHQGVVDGSAGAGRARLPEGEAVDRRNEPDRLPEEVPLLALLDLEVLRHGVGRARGVDHREAAVEAPWHGAPADGDEGVPQGAGQLVAAVRGGGAVRPVEVRLPEPVDALHVAAHVALGVPPRFGHPQPRAQELVERRGQNLAHRVQPQLLLLDCRELLRRQPVDWLEERVLVQDLVRPGDQVLRHLDLPLQPPLLEEEAQGLPDPLVLRREVGRLVVAVRLERLEEEGPHVRVLPARGAQDVALRPDVEAAPEVGVVDDAAQLVAAPPLAVVHHGRQDRRQPLDLGVLLDDVQVDVFREGTEGEPVVAERDAVRPDDELADVHVERGPARHALLGPLGVLEVHAGTGHADALSEPHVEEAGEKHLHEHEDDDEDAGEAGGTHAPADLLGLRPALPQVPDVQRLLALLLVLEEGLHRGGVRGRGVLYVRIVLRHRGKGRVLHNHRVPALRQSRARR
mmetsp:Transcript_16397/g.49351  ORF Transcript_16397/g.49351 Transcript_16397/m.49351 type:complete len:569 (-) Transcript_16397:60-1766(-)